MNPFNKLMFNENTVRRKKTKILDHNYLKEKLRKSKSNSSFGTSKSIQKEIEKIEILNDNSSEEENIFDKNYLLNNLLVLNYSKIKSKENLYDHQFVLGNYELNKKKNINFNILLN